MSVIARRVRVTGHVQGVWFRAWTKERATALRVMGWVRNCDDGSVEAHIEGAAGSVDRLIEQMRRGPSGARVEGILSVHAEPEKLSGFAVRE